MPASAPSPISSRRKQPRTPGKWKPARARLNCTWRGIGAQTNVREMRHALNLVVWSFVACRFFKLSVMRRQREELDSGGDELDETGCRLRVSLWPGRCRG